MTPNDTELIGPVPSGSIPVLGEEVTVTSRHVLVLRLRYYLARTNRRSKKHRPCGKLEPWQLARRNNRRQSRVLQLPDELLLHICSMIDKKTRLFFHETCYDFHRIALDMFMRDGTTKCMHLEELTAQLRFSRLPGPVYLAPHQCMNMQTTYEGPVIQRQYMGASYCQECRNISSGDRAMEIRKELSKHLWCSACGIFHRKSSFSGAQRKTPFYTRICISWEGRVRLCAHKSATWDEMNPRDGLPPFVDRVVTCQHRSHRSGLENPPPGLTRSGCPEIRIRSGTEDNVLSWTCPVFDIRPDIPITRAHLRAFLTSREDLFEHSFCPHVRPADLDFVFEQGQCACFDAPDTPPEDPETIRRHHPRCASDLDMEKCCRCRAFANPHLAGHLSIDRCETASDFYKWNRAHKYRCAHCPAEYSFIQDRGKRVYLQCIRRIEKCFPTSHHWLVNVDPSSWNIEEDEGLRNIMWCKNKGCRTTGRWIVWRQ